MSSSRKGCAAKQNAVQTNGSEQASGKDCGSFDAFQFYSVPENVQNARNLNPVDYSNDSSGSSSTPIERKTRISFETDLLAMMAGELNLLDEDFDEALIAGELNLLDEDFD